jgi:signal transduction histidine kinase/ActR/RegA family two-component response regulator
MRSLNSLSISTKLVLLGAVSGGVALLFCCLGFVAQDTVAFRNAKTKELRTQAEMLAFNSTAILTFRDANAGEQLLSSLRLQPSVDLACLYDDQGEILISYARESDHHRIPPPQGNAAGQRFTEDGHLELWQVVLDDGEVVGRLYLLANMDELHSQLWGYVRVSALMMFCSLAASVILSASLQRTISRPILALAEAARHVTQENDYSIRVESGSGAELGNLCQAFNRMLTQIETSKDALRKANDQLEERVKQRTAELEEEIDQRQKAQADLERSRDAAEAASRAKSEFLANMSHEIRTPLNGILGFSELLLDGADQLDEAERREFIQTISRSGEHLLALINDILDLSKIEADRLEVERVACSPHDLMAEVLSVLRVKAQEKRLSLECEWHGRIPETIQTDPARVRQLLMNLIGNAIKFTEAGAVRVAAQLDGDTASPQMVFEIIDTGVGIPPDKLTDIFDPFVQADNSVTRKYGGTGLGLAISRRIARTLGGDLTVQSKVGKGSTFTASVDTGPLGEVDSIACPAFESISLQKGKQKDASAALQSARILLVDDGDTNRKVVSIMLKRSGADVTTAEDGQIAVDLVAEREFDVILMDMQMPVMDGYMAARTLRQRGITIPIIALTAHAMKGDEEKCVAAGCSGYLTKPVKLEPLLNTVAEALESRGDRSPTEAVSATR